MQPPEARLVYEHDLMPGGAVVAQGTLNPLTLVRIQAGQPKLLVIGRPDEDTTMLQRDIS